MNYDVVIVGGGHAAANLATSLYRSKSSGPKPDVTVALISDEPQLPYHRPPLSKDWLTTDMPEEKLLLFPQKLYEAAKCDLYLGETVASLDVAKKQLYTGNGRTFNFGKLVLATGARPRKLNLGRLNLQGSDDAGISYLRDRADADLLKAKLSQSGKLIIIGGGYIGLEVAASARSMGVEVDILEAEDRILKRVTSPEVSEYFTRLHTQNGVKILTSTRLSKISKDAKHLVVSANHGVIAADHILVGIGVIPNSALAKSVGLDLLGDSIIVDKHCLTSSQDILAIGDNTVAPIPVYNDELMRIESVQNAADQASVACSTILGQEKIYDPVPWFWSNQYKLKLTIAGINRGYDTVIERRKSDSETTSFCYLRGGKLIALDAINNTPDFIAAQKLIRKGTMLDSTQLAEADRPLKSFL